MKTPILFKNLLITQTKGTKQKLTSNIFTTRPLRTTGLRKDTYKYLDQTWEGLSYE
jgi:hypothetical protein